MPLRTSTYLDDLINCGEQFKVLDDGFVRVVDYMGNDHAVVQAARISYGDGTKAVNDDHNLIRYLMRHHHTTPFEMCELKLHVRVPMDCWRQWIRHRTASVNEYSTRYSVAIDKAQRTEPNQWRLQNITNKQGSMPHFVGVDMVKAIELSHHEERLQDEARKVYEHRLLVGVSREQARKDLPLSTYTEAYWKIDLHNLLHFLQLRLDPHAQHEIRSYAKVIGEIVSQWVPWTWEAFQNYRLNSVTLTELDISAFRLGLISGNTPYQAMSNREKQEFESKLSKLGFVVDIDEGKIYRMY